MLPGSNVSRSRRFASCEQSMLCILLGRLLPGSFRVSDVAERTAPAARLIANRRSLLQVERAMGLHGS